MCRHTLAKLLVCLASCQTSCVSRDTQLSEPLAAREAAGFFASEADFHQWFAAYYQNPRPELVVEAFAYMLKSRLLEQQPDVAAAFFGKIFALHPERVDSWLADFSAYGVFEWEIILSALWLAASPEAHLTLKRHLDKALPVHRAQFEGQLERGTSDAEILNKPITNAREIGLVWAAFNATGNERYVHKIINLLKYHGDQNHPMTQVARAAFITLANNALHHRLVLEICLAEQEGHLDPQVRLLLNAMLSMLVESLQAP